MNNIERKVDIRILEAKLEIRSLTNFDISKLAPYVRNKTDRLSALQQEKQRMSSQLSPLFNSCSQVNDWGRYGGYMLGRFDL